ncbi:MAG: efflux RND transporter permease subunit [Planctomycetaceae bacterium]
MSIPRYSVENHVLVNMLMIVILVGGAVFAFTLVREMFPESRPDKLMIMAVHPGVQPQEIEKAITEKVEEAVRKIDGVEKVDSTVAEGMSSTIVTLYNEVTNVDAVLQELKNEIDAVPNFPPDMEQITIKKLEPKLPVISVAVYGEGDEQALKQAARDLRDELLLLPGVSDVEINGTRDDEISVEVQPQKLREYHVTFDDVAEAIRRTNLDISGGQLKGSRTSVSVRTLGEQTRGRDLEDLVVRTMPDGRQVRLSQVAVIRDELIESDLESYFNGKPAVHCVVFKTGAQDVIQIAGVVRGFVRGKQQAEFDPYGYTEAYAAPWYWKPFALVGATASRIVTETSAALVGRPDPMKIHRDSLGKPFDHNFDVALHTDLSRFVEGRLDLMTRNGRGGLLLVLLSLILFLNWRVAFWSAVGLPVSFLGTFIVMWMFGVTINLLTLFGLIIVLGIIVDDAIVIGENIYRHVEQGMPPRMAAIKGAEEVMWPVTIAVATTIGAFAPLFFIQGQIGTFMGQLPIVVIAALSVSLLEALVVLPAHLAHLPSKKAREEWREAHRAGLFERVAIGVGRARERFVQGALQKTYERFLRLALRWRYVTITVSISLMMLAGGLVAGGVVEAVFIQKMDSETLICFVEMPVGTTADNTRERLLQLSDYVKPPETETESEVENVQMFVSRQYDIAGAGTTGTNDQSHLGQLVIELMPADQREAKGLRSSEEMLADFRKFSMTLPGVNAVTWDEMSGGPGGKDIEIRVVGKDFDEIVQVAEKLKRELAGYQGVADLDDDYDEGKREVRLRLRESARPTGITVERLGGFVRSALYGREARRLTRNREDVRIMVRYPERFRENVHHLEEMWIPNAIAASSAATAGSASGSGNGSATEGRVGWVPVSEVAELIEDESYTTIHRSQQERSLTVFGEVDDAVAKSYEVLAGVGKTFAETIRPEHPDVRIEFLGSQEEMGKAFGGLKVAFPVAMLLIYMMLTGLFRSYFQPIVVMSAIPFSFLGAVLGHWVTGQPMTILSGIGMVALTGIVVNDSLVLVDFINRRIREGMEPFEASIEGAKLRLRAILLTTLTTVAGLTPLMFERSFQAKFLIPMAVTLTFGLAFATALTLIIVPCLNMVYFDVWSRRAPVEVE